MKYPNIKPILSPQSFRENIARDLAYLLVTCEHMQKRHTVISRYKNAANPVTKNWASLYFLAYSYTIEKAYTIFSKKFDDISCDYLLITR